MSLSVTPGVVPDCAPALVARRPPMATPSPAASAIARSPHRFRPCMRSPLVLTRSRAEGKTYCDRAPDGARSAGSAHQRAGTGLGELAAVDHGLAGHQRGDVAVGALDQ